MDNKRYDLINEDGWERIATIITTPEKAEIIKIFIENVINSTDSTAFENTPLIHLYEIDTTDSIIMI